MTFVEQVQALATLATTGLQATGMAADLAARVKKLFGSAEPTADADVKSLLADLVSQIADAKVANAELKIQLSALLQDALAEAEVKAKLDRYTLHQTAAGATVYALKHPEEEPTGQHFICPRCFEERRRSILQGSAAEKACLFCKAKFRFEPLKPSQPPIRRRKSLMSI